MAKEQIRQDVKQEAKGKEKFVREEKKYASIIRILQTDIPGNKKILVGLTYVKGVSWSISSAVCKILKIDPNKKIENLDRQEIEMVEEFLKNPKLPLFLMNRRRDFETGENKHLITTQLDITKEFDIRRLKKIRSYRGYRHALGQPTRGQRTRSHFRNKKKGKSIGVTKKKAEPAPAAKEKKGK